MDYANCADFKEYFPQIRAALRLGFGLNFLGELRIIEVTRR